MKNKIIKHEPISNLLDLQNKTLIKLQMSEWGFILDNGRRFFQRT
ncbi:MAG: hypothetical protein WC548_04675 [Candidatus Pacearchaeota archaeon]